MTYLIMKLYMAYAVALDNKGRFVKIANLGYKLGQKVTDVILLEDRSTSPRKNIIKQLTLFAAIAASFLIVAVSIWQLNFVTFGHINLKINPEVSIAVSRTRRVLELEGLNPDGVELIEGYKFKGLSQTKVTDDLVDMAIERGYLSDGGEISVSIASENLKWRKKTAKILGEDLQKHLVDMDVSVVLNTSYEEIDDFEKGESATIIIEIPINKGSITNPDDGDSLYDDGDSDYDDDGDSDYNDNGDSGYNDNGDSDYDDGDSFYNDDGDSLYDDGDSDYDDASG
ncbi:MAG: hypothetical protein GX222_01560 [Ruminococcaceae bacterium]|nr:hypothetical protein [Oscillospiraceae bacterium]